MNGAPAGDFRRRQGAAGAVVLCSPQLEAAAVAHGFATRLGGVSQGSFASLNFGIKGGDSPAQVAENLLRLGETVGFAADRCYRVQQVHGREVVMAEAGDPPGRLGSLQADALVADQPGLAVGVLTADCVPVLFADPRRGAVAAAHAGWRGLAGGVLEATIAALGRRAGSRPAELLAAIGPCIGACCYEVGEEVAANFAEVERGRGPRPFLDLPGAVRGRLLAAGLAPAQISSAGICTRCHPELFFSYRRDAEATGHHLSVIVAGQAGLARGP